MDILWVALGGLVGMILSWFILLPLMNAPYWYRMGIKDAQEFQKRMDSWSRLDIIIGGSWAMAIAYGRGFKKGMS